MLTAGRFLQSVTDIDNRTITYGFDTQQGISVLNTVSQINDSMMPQWVYNYTVGGVAPYLTQVEVPDPSGTQSMRSHPIYYGLDGKVQAMQDANGNAHSYVYNVGSTQVTVTDSTGDATQVLDAEHRVGGAGYGRGRRIG